MKANQELKNGTIQKKSKKENAPDILSKPCSKVCGEKVISKPMNQYGNNKTEAIQKLKNQSISNTKNIIIKSVLNAL